MFLPSGLGGADAARLPCTCGAPGRRGRGEDEAPDEAEGATFQEEEPLEGSDPEESLDETAESSILEDEIAQGDELDSLDGGAEVETNGNDE